MGSQNSCRSMVFGVFLGLVFVLATVFSFFGDADAEVYEAEQIPWSGYWWPYQYGGLATGWDYRGHPAPLEKYLLLTSGTASGPLIDWYLDHYYDPEAEPWWGLCHAWARASVTESYEILPSSENNIVFRVGDKKGLLTLCHDNDLCSWEFGDDPVRFHFWLLEYIYGQKKAFTADLDPGEEVWYFSIYRYDMSVFQNGSIESVTVKVTYAHDSVPPDYMGTASKTKTYTYDLTLNEQGEIIGGEWTGGSVNDHPDILIFPISSATSCPYIDCDEVRRVAQAQDDEFEAPGNAVATLDPGTYHLVLLDKDRYRLEGSPGDTAYIQVKREDATDTDLAVTMVDAGDSPVVEDLLAFRESDHTYQIWMENPPYILTLSFADYTEPDIYTLSYDLEKAFRQKVPSIPKDGKWMGFGLTNAGDDMAEEIYLVTRNQEEGIPLQTVYGPVNLNPGEKRVLSLTDLTWRDHEYADMDGLEMLSRQPVSFISLYGLPNQALAGFVQQEARGTRLVFPDVFSSGFTSRTIKDVVLNESYIEDAPVTLLVYSQSGELLFEESATVFAGASLELTRLSNPFGSIPEGAWLEVVSTDFVEISGYAYLKNPCRKRPTPRSSPISRTPMGYGRRA